MIYILKCSEVYKMIYTVKFSEVDKNIYTVLVKCNEVHKNDIHSEVVESNS